MTSPNLSRHSVHVTSKPGIDIVRYRIRYIVTMISQCKIRSDILWDDCFCKRVRPLFAGCCEVILPLKINKYNKGVGNNLLDYLLTIIIQESMICQGKISSKTHLNEFCRDVRPVAVSIIRRGVSRRFPIFNQRAI